MRRAAPPPRQLTVAALQRGTRALCRQDPDLALIVRRFGEAPLWGRRPGFSTLIRIILEQQVSLASARAMYARLAANVGVVEPATIRRAGRSGLRRIGFTRQKADYCVELAERIASGDLDLALVARSADVEGRRMLLEVRGLGRWSVDIYFLMALRRPDVWPHGDLALAEAACRLKRLTRRPDHDALARLAAPWAPWRAVGARLLWHYYLSTTRDGSPIGRHD